MPKIRGFYLYFPLVQLVCTILLSCITSTPLKAQTITPPPPQDILPRPNPETPRPETPSPLPSPGELLEPSSPRDPISEPELPPGVPENLTVERFEFEGSTVFSREELEEVTKDFTNRPISFGELLQARRAVTELYVNEGYVTSGALIPPQDLGTGVVTIQIIEGTLEGLNVEGEGRLNPNYVRSRLERATGAPLNVPRILEVLQKLQLDPLIENISAELSGGVRPGTSFLDIQFQSAETFDADVILDNGRSPSVGTFRREIQLTESNLTGFGDRLNFGYTNTDGSDVFEVSYGLPLVDPSGASLTLAYKTTSSDVIEPPFDEVDIESESRSYEVRFRQPIIQKPNQDFALGFKVSHQQSETSLLNEPFALSPGADDLGRTRVSAVRFFQEWTKRSEVQVLAARSEFSLGVGAFGATINNSSPDSNFFSWRAQAQWVRLLASDTILLARTDFQLSDRPLVPLEQFGLGGLGSVRGYRQDAFLTDNGVFASVELRLPILRLGGDGLIHVIPFVDFGTAWNNSNGTPTPDPNTLASVGLGLQWQQSDYLTARFDYGIDLIDVDSRDRTLQEQGFYFSLIFSPF